jgi:hypothetical protein
MMKNKHGRLFWVSAEKIAENTKAQKGCGEPA